MCNNTLADKERIFKFIYTLKIEIYRYFENRIRYGRDNPREMHTIDTLSYFDLREIVTDIKKYGFNNLIYYETYF